MTKAAAAATKLDEEMLVRNISSSGWTNGPAIAPSPTSDADLEQDYKKSGADVAVEIGGRLLLKYLRRPEVGTYVTSGTVSRRLHYVTVTMYRAADLNSFLALPFPNVPREHLLLIDPAGIGEIWGPRWVRWGAGIEYLLPNGFTSDDVAIPNTGPGLKWELEID
ncbi:MAG: hypothetical protein R3C39_03725 [Dehalococcoidia bacterium]